MWKNKNYSFFFKKKITEIVSSKLKTFFIDIYQPSIVIINRNYCYKHRKNPFEQWDDFMETSNIKLEKFESNKKINQLLKKQEEYMLSNLGLEKYVELFEQNLNATCHNNSNQVENENEELKFLEKFLDQRKFKDHNVEQFSNLIDSNETRELVQKILKDYELEKYNSSQVPSELDEEMMTDLLKFNRKIDLVKHLNYLFKREVRKFTRKMKQKVERIENEKRLAEKFSNSEHRTGLEYTSEGAPVYAKWKNTMFIAFNNNQLRKENERRQRDAVLFGPKMVLDFGFSNDIYNKLSFYTLTTQLFFTLHEITNAKIPFHLTLCSLGNDHPVSDHLKKKFPYIYQKNCLMDITGNSYLDLFPKDKLVYLSADAPKSLEKVDQSKVYIVGAFCDKFCHSDYSYQKAKAQGIATYKLPLEDYFFFKHDRVLTFNLVVGILERYLEFKNWKEAMIGKIPPRKLKTPEELRLEQIRKVRKFYSKEKFFKIYKANDNPNENTPSFKPNIFKSEEKRETLPKSSRFYNPEYIPNFRIKYAPHSNVNKSNIAKHSTDDNKSNSSIIKND